MAGLTKKDNQSILIQKNKLRKQDLFQKFTP